MSSPHRKRTTCRLCESSNLELKAPIVATPIGGDFLTADQLNTEQPAYPLDLYQCSDCGHVQLLDVIDPEVLFRHCTYSSGQTSLVSHFEKLANSTIAEHDLDEKDLVVDIGSNDGAFLSFFKSQGINVLGVDPALNLAEKARAIGVETVTELFDEDLAQKIASQYGQASAISALNVFAHTDDMIGAAKGVSTLLREDGIFIFEVSYAIDVLDKLLLGAIFHEHLCHHSVKPLVSFLERQDLELIHVRRVGIQGGSLICTAQKKGGPNKIDRSVAELIELEENSGLYDGKLLARFNARLENTREQVANVIDKVTREDKSIAAFGAARGGALYVYHFGLGDHIDYIVDDDPSKQGLYSPGFHSPVVETATLQSKKPDYVVILAWIHSEAIIKNNRSYLEQGGTFISFYPEFKLTNLETITS